MAKIIFKTKNKMQEIIIPDKPGLGKMRWAKGSAFAKKYPRKTLQEVLSNEIKLRKKHQGASETLSPPLTIIDQNGKQTTFYKPHGCALSVISKKINGQDVVIKQYFNRRYNTNLPDIEEYNLYKKMGAPLSKIIKIKKGTNEKIKVIEEWCGDSLLSLEKIKKQTAKDIYKELKIALKKWKKVKKLPAQLSLSHILYNPNKEPSNRITFIKPSYFVDYSKSKEKQLKWDIKDILKEKILT